MSQECNNCNKFSKLERKVLYLEKQVLYLKRMVFRKEPTSTKIEKIASAVIGGVLTYLINLLISKLID